jgi:hypothetical protein
MTHRNPLPKLVEPRPLDFHLSLAGEGENAGTALFYEVIGGYDPRSGKVLYLGRACDAESGLMLHELPYGSTDPKKMGRWWERTTGQTPPEALRPEELAPEKLAPAKPSREAGHASVEAA